MCREWQKGPLLMYLTAAVLFYKWVVYFGLWWSYSREQGKECRFVCRIIFLLEDRIVCVFYTVICVDWLVQWRVRTYTFCLSTTEVLNSTFVPVLFVVDKKTIIKDLCLYVYKADCLVLSFMSRTLLSTHRYRNDSNYLI